MMGSAYRAESEGHFTLHLRVLPGITYFIVRNEKTFPEYEVFAGRAKRTSGKHRFFHKIGTGFVLTASKVIAVSIPDLALYFHVMLDPESPPLSKSAA